MTNVSIALDVSLHKVQLHHIEDASNLIGNREHC